jgi:hypothetical protein
MMSAFGKAYVVVVKYLTTEISYLLVLKPVYWHIITLEKAIQELTIPRAWRDLAAAHFDGEIVVADDLTSVLA